ncbi:MAG: hypothetical protein AVDCRST_MAG20-845, partial [uncultured Acidimicrobiales bacterium]
CPTSVARSPKMGAWAQADRGRRRTGRRAGSTWSGYRWWRRRWLTSSTPWPGWMPAPGAPASTAAPRWTRRCWSSGLPPEPAPCTP